MTKEDLMQIKQLLDEQKQDITELMDQKLAKSEERTQRYMNVLIESKIQPQLNLLAEGLADIQEKLVPRSRVDELEEEIKFMKVVCRQMAEDIAKLKKAQ